MFHNRGLPFIKIHYLPHGYDWAICLSHDVDHLSMREHSRDLTVPKFLGTCFVGVMKKRKGLLDFLELFVKVSCSVFLRAENMPDPWDNINELIQAEKKFGVHSTFFFSATDGAPKSLGIVYTLKSARSFVQAISKNDFEFSTHGHNFDNYQGMSAEFNKISTINNSFRPLGIRMHYLRFNSSKTLSCAEQVGYLYDCTYGYSKSTGLRSGTLRPYVVPDLSIIEIPLNIMDTSLFSPFYMNCDLNRGQIITEKLITEAKKYGGTLSILFHPTSMLQPSISRQWILWLLKRSSDDDSCWKVSCSELAKWHKDWFNLRVNVEINEHKLILSFSCPMHEPLSLELTSPLSSQNRGIRMPKDETNLHIEFENTSINTQTQSKSLNHA